MGQYYKPCILAEKTGDDEKETVLGWMYSHKYDNGLKLMEHSWLRNDFVNTLQNNILLCFLIIYQQSGRWKHRPFLLWIHQV